MLFNESVNGTIHKEPFQIRSGPLSFGVLNQIQIRSGSEFNLTFMSLQIDAHHNLAHQGCDDFTLESNLKTQCEHIEKNQI